jgi:L-iditol 2-dehydrogenase
MFTSMLNAVRGKEREQGFTLVELLIVILIVALLMLLNVFLLLVCYSVIKTVREPLILLGGGAELRSYAAAGQALVERGLLAIPPEVSFEEATFIEPVNTCQKAVQKARVSPGETVAVIGQGPIGLLLMLLCRLKGATVITSVPMPERRAKSLQLGAAAALDPVVGDLVGELRERTEGRGADAVLLAVPNPSLVTEALALARPGGRVLLFAQNDPHMQIEFPAAAVGVEEKEILGSYSAAVDLQEESARLVFTRQLPVSELVSHRFPLEQIEQALALAARPAGDSLKVVITR